VDFAAFAPPQGAGATRVDHEAQLDGALSDAMAADGPFLVDVRIDPASRAPASRRNAALAGRRTPGAERTFPLREGE
jgi:acetolactate synthase-1/2/3 large subunit